MDSITQIVLGAATGEAARGRKLGNKAMFWGAVGGTIPDLDVLIGSGLESIGLMDEMGALAFHRGITHSLFFAFTMPFILGKIVDWHYKNPNRRYVSFIGSLMVFLLIAFATNYVFAQFNGGEINKAVFGFTVIAGVLFGYFFNHRYFKRELSVVDANWKDFAWVFFWSIFTHPLLDCCTTFGTQLFLPFSDYRVGFNNISVADPIYTIPFLLCLVAARLMLKDNRWRRYFLWAGIGISSAYMLFTFYNKTRVNKIFEDSFASHGIEYNRYMTSPTIFNNILWNGIAEGDTAYYQALYSFNDKADLIPEFRVFPKNHHLIQDHENDRSVKILKWFSNNYFTIMIRKDGKLQLNDMRYGTFNDSQEPDEKDFIFKFILEDKNGILEAREGDRDRGEEGFGPLVERMKGK